MQEITPKTDIQKSNVENDDLIDDKGILLGFLVTIRQNDHGNIQIFI